MHISYRTRDAAVGYKYNPGGEDRYKYCKRCNLDFTPENGFVKPDPQQTHMQSLYQQQKVYEAAVNSHLLDCCLAKCEHCDTAVKRTSLKAHQKSSTCIQKQRLKKLEKDNLVVVRWAIEAFEKDFLSLKDEISYGLRWDDGATRAKVERDCALAIEKFKKLCKIEYHRVHWGPGRTLTWVDGAFAPKPIALALNYLTDWRSKKLYANKQERLHKMWEFLYANKKDREGMICLWELSAEGE